VRLITALTGGISRSFIPRKGTNLVASDPLVLGAGGTTLDLSHTTGAWIGETTWGFPPATPALASRHRAGGSAMSSAGPFTRAVSTALTQRAASPTSRPTPTPTPG
jgi:hypothetical protein